MEVFLIKECKAFTADPRSTARFLSAFKPEKCLYLFEPRKDKVTEPDQIIDMRTIATVSPLYERVKEFCKNGGIKFYMPLWELEELQAVGAFIAAREPHLAEIYTNDAITARFNSYGGIIRYVLPRSQTEIKATEYNQQQALSVADLSLLFREGANIDGRERNVNHFLLQYQVCRDTFLTFQLALPPTRALLVKAIEANTYIEVITALWNCERGVQSYAAERLFEFAAPQIWAKGGAKWDCGTGEADLPERLTTKFFTQDECPTADEMEEGVLYVARMSNFVFVEGFFKHLGEVHAYNCKSGAIPKYPSPEIVEKFRSLIQLSSKKPLHVWYITLKMHASKWRDHFNRPAFTEKVNKKTWGNTTFGVITYTYPNNIV